MRTDVETAVVEVRFLSAAESGRPSPVNSDYRAQLVFRRDGRAEVEHDCVFDFARSANAIDRDGDKWLPLGIEDQALIAPFDASRMADVVVPGAEFDVYEGRTLVGSGTVREGLARRT